MTTFDFWITDLDGGGRDLGRHGSRSHAIDLASTLWRFLMADRAPKTPGHLNVADMVTVVSGVVLAELFQETEQRKGCVLNQPDGTRSVALIDPTHRYELAYLEY